MRTWLWAIAALLLVVTTAGCGPQLLDAHWHLVRSGPDTERKQKVYVLVTNVGKEQADLKWLRISDTEGRDVKLPPQSIPPGGIRVIDLGDFRCIFPTKVTAEDARRGEVHFDIPTVPSTLPREAETTCCWKNDAGKCVTASDRKP